MRAIIISMMLLLCAWSPWQPVIEIPCCQTIAYSTWNTSINSSAITYSNGNLTWTCTACTGNYFIAQGTNNHASGQFYLEVTATTVAGGCCYATGFAPSGVVPNGPSSNLGFGFGVGYYVGGTVQVQGGATYTLPTYTDGDNIGVAVDLNNKLLWYRKNGGAWNSGVAGTQDPATGQGGLNIAPLPSLNLYPTQSVYNNSNESGTINVGASTFAYTAPSGFSAWH